MMAKPMLQSNNGEICSQIPFTVVSAKPANDTFDAPCPVSAELMNLFEDITGWKIEFAESKASHSRRKMAEEQGAEERGIDDQAIIEGIFSIVDMSEKWPAQKPTCHRAKCDDLVKLFDSLYGELQATKQDLHQTRSALAGIAPEAIEVDQNEILTDSFVPKFNHNRRWDDSSFELATDPANSGVAIDTQETAYPIEIDTDPNTGSPVAPPFEGWALGGQTGVAEKAYVDWLVSNNEKIVVTSGKIESSFGTGDSQTIVEVDPLTNEYCVSGSEDLGTFYLWDSKTKTVSPLEVSPQWLRLKSGQAIVATTSVKFCELVGVGKIDARVAPPVQPNSTTSTSSPKPFTAQRISELLSQKLDALEEFEEFNSQQDKLLVLMRESRTV